MVAFNHLLAGVLAFGSVSTVLGMPTGNATLKARAPRKLCGSSKRPGANEALLAQGPGANTAELIDINVYWHVVYADETKDGGYLSDEEIQSSMDVLNSDFSGAGISFNLQDTTRTQNPTWFNEANAGDDDDESDNKVSAEMKRELHTGTAKDLNIWSVGLPDADLIGYATFPWEYTAQPQLDGVVLKHTTVPGGPDPKFNLGKTLTHEVGHWVGLYHTFEGGCSDVEGDHVLDTPAEADAAEGCPTEPRNTCPDSPGDDPIHNFMDYTDDVCLTEFTLGQTARLLTAILCYRFGNPDLCPGLVV